MCRDNDHKIQTDEIYDKKIDSDYVLSSFKDINKNDYDTSSSYGSSVNSQIETSETWNTYLIKESFKNNKYKYRIKKRIRASFHEDEFYEIVTSSVEEGDFYELFSKEEDFSTSKDE
jgi:hypothetical protein